MKLESTVAFQTRNNELILQNNGFFGVGGTRFVSDRYWFRDIGN
jgi:hypothetical protein